MRESWRYATEYIKPTVKKFSRAHRVIIHFDRRVGFYVGGSLGLALTICLIRELVRYYDPRRRIEPVAGLAVTGGLQADGSVPELGDDITARKTELVFFSSAAWLVLPKQNEHRARAELAQLTRQYPRRKLKIVPVEHISEVLARRDLITIIEIPYYQRVLSFLRVHHYRLVIHSLILIALYYFLTGYFEHTPHSWKYSKNHLTVLSERGKPLWSKPLRPLKGENEPAPKQIYFLDVNADGAREVIVCDEVTEGTNHNRAQGNVICYDEAGKRLWKYELNDSVKTSGEVFKPPFLLFILDTMTYKDRLMLFCAGYHTPYFPTAIFGLDAKTGRRVTGLVWHAGRLRDGVIVKAGDKKLLIATAVSNAFNRPVIFSIDANNLVNSQLPAIPKYEFSALPRCTFEQYVLLPNSDLCAYNGSRYEYPDYSRIMTIPERNALEFSLIVSPRYGLRYKTTAVLDSFDIIIGDEFKVYRDKLIEEKKLTPPLTFDPAYKALLLRDLRFINH